MGKRGPAGRSPNEKKLDGNPGKREIPIEIFTPEGAPFVPDHLSDDAQQCAEHIIRMFKTKRLSAPDSYALAAFATAWAWHKAAAHEMNSPEFEAVIDGSAGNRVPNPWFKILNEQSRIMLAWAAKLYLTPADRAALPNPDQEPPPSKFAGLIGQPASLRSSKH